MFDTKVLVAAARSRTGASFALVESLSLGHGKPCVSTASLLEYEEPLKPVAADLGAPFSDGDDFLDYGPSISMRGSTFFLLRPLLNDPDDDIVLELAVAAEADTIVTFNRRHLLPMYSGCSKPTTATSDGSVRSPVSRSGSVSGQ